MESVKKLEPGIRGKKEFVVAEKHMANEVGSGLVSVFSTAMMIGGMEAACVAAVEPYMEEGSTTVGVEVHVFHDAATPLGMKACFEAELREISANGRGLLFDVQASDQSGPIGHGTIRRVIVNRAKFEERARAKLKGD